MTATGLITPASLLGTLAVYLLIRRLYLKTGNPLFNIVALSAGLIIAGLLGAGLDYEDYEPAKNIITWLLGPATVSLALPLYRYRLLLKRYFPAIITSVVTGSFLAMFSAGLIAQAGGLPPEVVISVLPKGASIPFGLEVANMYGGIPALTAAFAVVTGTLGSLLGGWTLNRVKMADPLARGLALGTVSHAQGTAAALLEGQEEGAMAGLAMILAGLFTVALAPPTVWLLKLLAA